MTTRILAAANRLRVSIRVNKNFDQGRGRGQPVKIILLSSLITMQNLVIVSRTMCAHSWDPNNLGNAGPSLGRGRRWPWRNTPLFHIYYHIPSLVAPRQTMRTIRRSAVWIWPIVSRLSRSLKVGGTHTDRSAIYNFLLLIHSNHGPISYCFREKQRFRLKIAIFSTPCN